MKVARYFGFLFVRIGDAFINSKSVSGVTSKPAANFWAERQGNCPIIVPNNVCIKIIVDCWNKSKRYKIGRSLCDLPRHLANWKRLVLSNGIFYECLKTVESFVRRVIGREIKKAWAQLTALEALGSPSTDKLAHTFFKRHEPFTYCLVLLKFPRFLMQDY